MRGVPVAIPFAWTSAGAFFLQSDRFRVEIDSDCLRHRGFVR